MSDGNGGIQGLQNRRNRRDGEHLRTDMMDDSGVVERTVLPLGHGSLSTSNYRNIVQVSLGVGGYGRFKYGWVSESYTGINLYSKNV